MHYENSIISTIYPNVAFNSGINASFLRDLGKKRDKIVEYMTNDFNEYENFLIIDGHRILSASKTLEHAEKGYDSKKRFMPQINLMYIFSESDETGAPIFYKKYTGSTPDVKAFKDLLIEVKNSVKFKDFTVVGDKGIPSEEGFEILDELCIKYVMPLRRGNKYVKDMQPLTLDKYDATFSYHSRPIHCKEIYSCENYKVFLYYDTKLFAEEDQDIVLRLEKANNAIEEKRIFEEKLRSNGNGRMSDEEYMLWTSQAVTAEMNFTTPELNLTKNQEIALKKYCKWTTPAPTNRDLTFKMGTSGVISISEDGKTLKAIGAGSTTLTAKTVDGNESTMTIYVK